MIIITCTYYLWLLLFYGTINIDFEHLNFKCFILEIDNDVTLCVYKTLIL